MWTTLGLEPVRQEHLECAKKNLRDRSPGRSIRPALEVRLHMETMTRMDGRARLSSTSGSVRSSMGYDWSKLLALAGPAQAAYLVARHYAFPIS